MQREQCGDDSRERPAPFNFNTEDNVPNKNPHAEGQQAFHNGLPLSSCPYPSDSEDAVDWEGGFIEAEENDGEEE